MPARQSSCGRGGNHSVRGFVMRQFRFPSAFLAGVLAVAASLLPQRAAAQTADSVWVTGVVVDSAGQPIDRAQLFLEPNSSVVLSDTLGRFLVRAESGPVLLIARRLGYAIFVSEVDLEPGRDRRFRIVMRPAPVTLDAVETRATRRQYRPEGVPATLEDFYWRRATGRGRYFTREDFERLGGFRGVIGSVPGLRAASGGTGRLSEVSMTRCPPDLRGQAQSIAWYLDGFRVIAMPDLMDSEIEAIEVYRGASQLPADAVGNSCGAIFVWTRRAP